MSATDTVDKSDHSVLIHNGVTDMSKSNSSNIDTGEVITEIEMKSNLKIENEMKNAQKTNWVKFDDDDMVVSAATATAITTTTTTTVTTIPTVQTELTKSSNVTPTTTVSTIPHPPVSVHSNKSVVSTSSDIAPAVLATESVHVNLNSNSTNLQRVNSTPATIPAGNDVPKSISASVSPPAPMRTIELSTGRIREGFANGDVIVTLLPTNTRWPWITPAIFRPELVPEELMAQGLTLTVEEYVNAMEMLVNDYRFTVYNICYKRVLVCWILFAFCVLLTLLFSGLQGIALFSLGVGWLFLNAAAIFLCMWIKLRLSRGLEKCLARVNKQLVRHKLLLVLDDRGRISCHKVNLCFLYFDPAQCIAYLNEFIERSEQNGTNIQAGWESKLDLDVSDIVIQGNNPVRLSRKQAIAQEIILSYIQRWGKDFLRRRLDWTVNEAGVHETPRHLMSSICPCQYTEEILNNKIKMENKKCCCGLRNPFREFC